MTSSSGPIFRYLRALYAPFFLTVVFLAIGLAEPADLSIGAGCAGCALGVALEGVAAAGFFSGSPGFAAPAAGGGSAIGWIGVGGSLKGLLVALAIHSSIPVSLPK